MNATAGSVFLALALVSSMAAQSQQSRESSYTYDVNGQRVLSSQYGASAKDGLVSHTQVLQNLNGRKSPLEESTERVLEQRPGFRVVERTIQAFDQNGNPAGKERVVIRETTRPDGTSSVNTKTYRSDINGRLALAENATTESRRSGDRLQSNTTVERPTLNGGFAVAEKKVLYATVTGNRTEEDETVYRDNGNGTFVPAYREIRDRQNEGAVVKETVREYEGTTGKLELYRQRDTTETKGAAGAETRKTDVFAATIPGQGRSDQLALREQQVIVRQPQSGGGFVETFKVRQPLPNDPNRFEPYKTVSETVCTGTCNLLTGSGANQNLGSEAVKVQTLPDEAKAEKKQP